MADPHSPPSPALLSWCAAGVTYTYLAGPVGEPGSPDASLAAPVRQKETNLADFVADVLISFYKVGVCS